MSNTQALNDQQIQILDIWYQLQQNKLHHLLSSINKASLIPHLDSRYHVKPEEAESLMMFSDLLKELIDKAG